MQRASQVLLTSSLGLPPSFILGGFKLLMWVPRLTHSKLCIIILKRDTRPTLICTSFWVLDWLLNMKHFLIFHIWYQQLRNQQLLLKYLFVWGKKKRFDNPNFNISKTFQLKNQYKKNNIMDFLFVRGWSPMEKPTRGWVFVSHGLQQKSIKIISFFQPILSLINLGQTSFISIWYGNLGLTFLLLSIWIACLILGHKSFSNILKD